MSVSHKLDLDDSCSICNECGGQYPYHRPKCPASPLCSPVSNKPELVGVFDRHWTPESGAYYTDSDAASEKQVGGDHYKEMAIQPSEFIYRNGLNWLQGNAIKYICRHNRKHGAQDLDKAIHYLELLKEWEYDHDRQQREGSD